MARPLRFARPLLALLALAVCAHLDARTFTAKDGRTMEADILGYKGETLRVRRTDTGREFSIPLSSLTEADQRALRQFMRENPELRDTVPPHAFRVEYSKARSDTERSGGSVHDVRIENWGYSFNVINLSSAPLENLRLDYIVFAKRDPDRVQATTSREALERVHGSLPIESVAVHGKALLYSETIACRTDKLGSNARWVTSSGKLTSKLRDKELHGVWFRLYDGDKIIHEASSPESLRTSERWISQAEGK